MWFPHSINYPNCYIFFFVSFVCFQETAELEKAGTVSMFAELTKAVEKSQAEPLEVVEMGQRAAELRSQAFICDLQTESLNLEIDAAPSIS